MPDADLVLSSRWRRLSPALRGGSLAVLAGAFGYLLNAEPIYIADGASLVVGGVATLALALRYGPLWGALAAAIAFLPTVFYWEQPVSWGLAIAEGILVGSLRKRPPAKLQLLHFAYWATIGSLALAAHYFLVRGVTFTHGTLVLLKSVANASLALGLAQVALSVPRIWGIDWLAPSERREVSLHEYLIGAAAMAIAVPAVLVTLALSRSFEQRTLLAEGRAAQTLAAAVTQSLSSVMEERLAYLEGIARSVGGGDAVSQEQADQLLQNFGGTSVAFLTMLVTDAGGEVIASFAKDSGLFATARSTRFNVADRTYFKAPRATRRPFVSDPFVGRGFGSDLIVALSVPIVGGNGEFLGVVEGSISTAALRGYISNVPSAYRVSVVSRGGQVVAWTESDTPPAAPFHKELPPLLLSEPFAPGEPGLEYVLSERRDEPGLPLAQQRRLVAVLPTQWSWNVKVSRTYGDALASVRSLAQLATLGALVAFLLLRILFTRVLRDVLQPLGSLVESVQSRRDGDRAPEAVAPRLSAGTPIEIRTLADGLDEMRAALFTRFTALREAVRAREDVNAQLEQTMLALDDLVDKRTKELEVALQEARAGSAAKAEFLASMSHELRTPLNAIVGAVETLRDGFKGPLTEPQLRTLDNVDDSAQHLLALISDVLDMERIETGRLVVKREQVDMRALAERVRSGIQPMADAAHLSLQVHLPAGALWMNGDPLRLQQVLLNLLSNSVKFTPAGGQVTLRLATGAVPGRVTRLEVEDTGIGIPEDQRERVFEPFAQVESGHTRRFAGTGLGLSISRALCDAMGLSLRIERSGPSGTVFSVSA